MSGIFFFFNTCTRALIHNFGNLLLSVAKIKKIGRVNTYDHLEFRNSFR